MQYGLKLPCQNAGLRDGGDRALKAEPRPFARVSRSVPAGGHPTVVVSCGAAFRGIERGHVVGTLSDT